MSYPSSFSELICSKKLSINFIVASCVPNGVFSFYPNIIYSIMKCPYCQSKGIKKGMRNHIQRYHCPSCNHHFQASYQKLRIGPEEYAQVVKLNNEGCGISSIGRLLRISKSSVQRMLLKIAGNMEARHSQEENESYEIDELRTFCGNKKKEC
ncbi:MAG: hypothetical protein RR385_10105, partial [Clostridiales bacterium]